jgi:hypothetical protein
MPVPRDPKACAVGLSLADKIVVDTCCASR